MSTSQIIHKEEHMMNSQIDEIESNISYSEMYHDKVSMVNVGWHLDHSLKVINKVFSSMKKSDPANYKWRPNILKSLIFLTGKIMRGKGKAPKAVQPPEIIEIEDIQNQVKESRTNLLEINKIDKNAHFKHPYFGLLNKKDTITFLKIHTNHHLAIVRDIIKNNS